METSSKKLDDAKVEITVKVPANDVDNEFKNVYKEAGNVRIPGFRKGRAPRKILENAYGGKDYFRAKATDAIVESSALIAIDEEGYVPIGTPDFPEFDMASEGADYEYKFTLEVTPQMELESYDAVNIELPSTEPTEEQINSRIDTLREYYVTYEEPEEEGGEKVKKLPELTDAWVKETLEFDGVDDLKARVADSIRSNNEATHDTVKQYLVSAELANRLKGEPPA
ncbi:MAG: trigger factor family protein [Coriobacteriales bacterium]|nr:trigger factor family protein [Coriobacteriales bacterium]